MDRGPAQQVAAGQGKAFHWGPRMSYVPHQMTDEQKRRRAADHVHDAIHSLKKAVRVNDGLEWGHILEGEITDLEIIENGLRRYANQT